MTLHDENTLTPVLRQAVDIFKLILFKELKIALGQQHTGASAAHIAQLAGATLNALFGVVNDAEPHVAFAQQHDDELQQALRDLATNHRDLREPLTDALRVQFLCDAEDGIDSEHILAHADDIGLLVKDRDTPLPKTFMHLARVLGVAHGILDPTSGPQVDDQN